MIETIYKLSKSFDERNRFKLFLLIIQESSLCNLKYDKPAYRGNCTTNLSRKLNLSQSTLSYHLKVLEDNGLITRRKRGKWEHFFPNFKLLDEVQEVMTSIGKGNIEGKMIKLLKTYPTKKDFGINEFEELVSLISNHNFSILHETFRQRTRVTFMRSEKDIKLVFVLIFNPDTKIITLQSQEISLLEDDQSNVPDTKTIISRTIENLISKYLPVIGREKLLV